MLIELTRKQVDIVARAIEAYPQIRDKTKDTILTILETTNARIAALEAENAALRQMAGVAQSLATQVLGYSGLPESIIALAKEVAGE